MIAKGNCGKALIMLSKIETGEVHATNTRLIGRMCNEKNNRLKRLLIPQVTLSQDVPQHSITANFSRQRSPNILNTTLCHVI